MGKGTVGSALKTTNGGSPNFKTFGTQLNRIPAAYRAELFTAEQNERLRDIVNTSNLLGWDADPSVSCKLTQRTLEVSALATSPFHPVAAVLPLLPSGAIDEFTYICELAHGTECVAAGRNPPVMAL